MLDFVNPFFQRALEESDISDKEDVLEYVKAHGSLHGHPAAEHPALKPYITAHEIAPDWHIRMQASFQKGVDNSISKTINLPNSATYDDVREAYMLAWNLGCLGITIFRDGSKGEQVLNVGVKEAEEEERSTEPARTGAGACGDQMTAPDVLQPAPRPWPSLGSPQPVPQPVISTYPNGVKPRPEVMSGLYPAGAGAGGHGQHHAQ